MACPLLSRPVHSRRPMKPVSPVMIIRAILFTHYMLDEFELLYLSVDDLVILAASDIDPVPLELIGDNLLSGLDGEVDEVRHLGRSTAFDMIGDRPVQSIDARIDVVGERRLLADGGDSVTGSRELHYTVLEIDIQTSNDHRDVGARVHVVLEECVEVQVGEDVGVHDNEVIIKLLLEVSDATGSTEVLLLPEICNINTVPATCSEVILDELRLVVQCKDDVVHTMLRKLSDDDLEKRHIPYGEHRFRHKVCEWS